MRVFSEELRDFGSSWKTFAEGNVAQAIHAVGNASLVEAYGG